MGVGALASRRLVQKASCGASHTSSSDSRVRSAGSVSKLEPGATPRAVSAASDKGPPSMQRTCEKRSVPLPVATSSPPSSTATTAPGASSELAPVSTASPSSNAPLGRTAFGVPTGFG
jgi:hypothetical protein